MRYRLTLFDQPKGSWRATRAEVMADAIELGLASWDAEAREYFLPVPGGYQADAGPPPALTRIGERLAEANMIQRVHGEGAAAHIADRIEALRLAGDMPGVRRWTEIAHALATLARKPH